MLRLFLCVTIKNNLKNNQSYTLGSDVTIRRRKLKVLCFICRKMEKYFMDKYKIIQWQTK